MTEQIKRSIDTLKTMYPKKYKMVDGRLTGGYDDYESEKGQAITSAIRSLQAWEEVLQELENIFSDEHENQYGNGINKAIDIINQHLAEIEERN